MSDLGTDLEFAISHSCKLGARMREWRLQQMATFKDLCSDCAELASTLASALHPSVSSIVKD
eukprot:7527664-Karenia_brevis.AAC.1